MDLRLFSFQNRLSNEHISIQGEKLWILIKYEKLTKFCFKCGKILHLTVVNAFSDLNDTKQLGPWLRSELRRHGTSPTVGGKLNDTTRTKPPEKNP